MARRPTTHIRVSQTTKDRLDLEIERLVRAAEQGRREHDRPDGNNNQAFKGMSHDDVIVRLLDRDAALRRRQKASAAKRRRKPPQDNDPAVSNHGGDE